MLEIDAGRIKEVLGQRDEELVYIHNRILALYDELQNEDSVLEEIAYKTNQWKNGGIQSFGSSSDLTDVMIRHERIAREHEIEIRAELYFLVEKEESICRIWNCFHALQVREFSILEDLYVKKLPYKAVECNSSLSHKTFEKIRSSGIENIMRLYNSDFTNAQIISSAKEIRAEKNRRKGKGKGRGKRRDSGKKEIYEQLSFDFTK